MKVNKFKLIFLFFIFIVSFLNSASVVGLASWYGEDFHGKTTANGENFDMTAFTAAHKEFPFNTFVRVRNLLNNRVVIVRINDRGPFRKDRIIDLSKAAADKLDFINIGVAPVKIEVLEKSDKTDSISSDVLNTKDNQFLSSKEVKPFSDNSISDLPSVYNLDTTSYEPDFYIQVGSYKIKEYASRAYKDLKNLGLTAVVNYRESFYTVFIPSSSDDLQKTVKLIESSGYKDVLVRKTKVSGVKVDLE